MGGKGQVNREFTSNVDDEIFDYVVKRQRRKTLSLHVLDDASVEVRAPNWLANGEIINFVEQRVTWIIEQRKKRIAILKAKPGYYHGQKHAYLGVTYPLLISVGKRSSVSVVGSADVESDSFQTERLTAWSMTVPDVSDTTRIQKLLEQWYRKQASTIFNARMRECFLLFPAWFQSQYRRPEITIRKMRRRWGSCSNKGAVTLNLLLIKMPIECIDYVIVHELCHLKEFHHGRAFYQLLSEVMPEWRKAERLIEELSDR